MSDVRKFGDQDIVPLKPVDVKDRFGLAAAVYAINALYIRSGKEPVGMLEVRTRIAVLIKHADMEKLAILLQEWYLETIDIPSAKELLNKLPAMIEVEDKRRYLHNPFVNDIEWSALATIYDCCIAVKFLAKTRPQLSTSEQNPGWKIAVPTPKFFGSTPSPASYAGNSCVFMVCHSSPKLSTYVPLIPCDQKVFAPGRSLMSEDNPKDVSDIRPALFSRISASKLPLILELSLNVPLTYNTTPNR